MLRVFSIACISCAIFVFSTGALAQDGSARQQTGVHNVSFPTSDGGRIVATSYGTGKHAVVLAHGARFNKESWSKQARLLMREGLRVLALDFRGYGKSRAGTQKGALQLDVLAAIRYLHDHGARRVSVLGGSMGGGAAARAAVESKEGEIDRLILLAPVPIRRPEDLKGKKLFIVSKGDRLKTRVKQQYDAAPQPKRLVVLDGNAHAQNIFATEHGDELMKLIVVWLTADPLDTGPLE